MAHYGRALDRGTRQKPEALQRAQRRLERLARAAADRSTGAVLAALLAIDLCSAAVFTGAGAATGDAALFFREGMPGTWLSFAQLGLAAFVAWMVHALERPGGAWHGDFWGLAAAVFAVFALDEILGTSQIIGTWLNQDAGLAPAGDFRDVGSVLLTLLFAGAALVLLPRALDLLRRPLAAALLVAGAALGAGSQALDSFVKASEWEFVAEETLKLGAEAFLLTGFVVALRSALAMRRRGCSGPAGSAPA